MTAPTTFQEFADALSDAAPRLSPQQRLIAQHVLEHPDDFALGTAATVAEAAGVQPSALVRFANALSFSGFSDLQQVFRHRLLQQAGTYRERISAMKASKPARGNAALLQSSIEQGVSDLHTLERSVNDEALQQAARLLSAADRVHVLAQRRAFPVAAYLAYAFGQLHVCVQSHDCARGTSSASPAPRSISAASRSAAGSKTCAPSPSTSAARRPIRRSAVPAWG